MTKGAILAHVSYLTWASKAVAAANRDWRSRRPYRGDVLIERESLHQHLFSWAIAKGLLIDPGTLRKHSHSFYVSSAFERHPELVKEEARRFWRAMIRASR